MSDFVFALAPSSLTKILPPISREGLSRRCFNREPLITKNFFRIKLNLLRIIFIFTKLGGKIPQKIGFFLNKNFTTYFPRETIKTLFECRAINHINFFAN